ncbi:MAG: LysR family transcriptional regulator [Rhodobacteraceae bacterium]|nr:LysR family transcriptional regulator [Paracoccaceae bacterium]
MPRNRRKKGILDKGLKLTHLRLVNALDRTGGMQAAADYLSIAQPAASRLAAEIDQILGQKIHQRLGKGIELTAAGHALAKRAARILQEIEDVEQEILEIGHGLTGSVRIGSVTGPAIEYILPVLKEARLTMPKVTISVEISTSDILADRLANGELDFVLGRLPSAHPPELFDEIPIAAEPVSFIARTDHALVMLKKVSVEQMLTFNWVLPFKGTILLNTIEQALRQRGHSLPTQTFTTSSFLLTLALVRQTNAIAPIATSVAVEFSGTSRDMEPLGIINSDLNVSVEMFSLLKLAARVFSPATKAVYDATLNSVKPEYV